MPELETQSAETALIEAAMASDEAAFIKQRAARDVAAAKNALISVTEGNDPQWRGNDQRQPQIDEAREALSAADAALSAAAADEAEAASLFRTAIFALKRQRLVGVS
jgi:hypothetical protein